MKKEDKQRCDSTKNLLGKNERVKGQMLDLASNRIEYTRVIC